MRIVLSTFGSFGDLHPYMAIGLELRARGHHVVIATMELYREKIESVGLTIAPVRPKLSPPREQDQELLDQILHPRKGPQYLMEQVIFPAVRDSYADLLEAVVGADLLVTHPAAPAGPLVGRKTGMKWISTVLAPISFFSAYDPPVPPYGAWLNKLRILGPGFMSVFHNLVKRAISARQVDQLRDELGVTEYGNPLFEGQHSPALVLALFSSVFALPQPDWPAQTRIAGFPFYDGGLEAPVPQALLDFLDQGPSPIVFTLGSTAVWVAEDFFKESIEASRRLNRRAVLLIGDERNTPPALPEGVIAVDYAPFQSLLPRACAVVHSGGIGSTAQGLRAGVPTLIVPFAFDQPDNADHARRLGGSRTLARDKYSANTATRELGELLGNPAYAKRAREIGEKIRRENGAARAADLIEHALGLGADKEVLAYAAGD
jgi:UDP:flavonoid glycosyltransferase YjiC (YdhE family)